MKSLLLIVSALAFSGCSLSGIHIFKKTVPADLTEKPAAQVEGEKRGAAFIVQATTPPVADPAAAVVHVHEVAAALSDSLGQPDEPVKVDDSAAIIASLRTGLQAKEKQLDAWKAFGRKYGGQPVEGTGINLAGPAGLVGLVIVVGLCVAFPPLGYLLLRVLPLVWGAFRRMVKSVQEFSAAHPEAANQLKDTLSKRMDEGHKALVRRLRTSNAA